MKMDAEVAIIGAGPIGIELAVVLQAQGISYLLFDKEQIGQMIYNFPPQTHFFSSPERIALAGIPIQTIDQQRCSREQYLAYLRSLVMHFGIKAHTYEEVVSIKKWKPSGFDLTTQSAKGKRTYRTRYLVLATGSTSKPRLLNIPGEDLPHVSVKMQDPHVYFGKKVVVIGGKNSAAETALRCYHAGAHVTLVVRRKELTTDQIKYWILPELLSLIQSGQIHCFYDAGVTEIKSDRVVIAVGPKHTEKVVEADFVIKALGFELDSGLFKQLGVALSSRNAPQFNPKTMETNVEDVWVVGTATGGTQTKYVVFIENSHEHAFKVTEAICQRAGRKYTLPSPHFVMANRLEE